MRGKHNNLDICYLSQYYFDLPKRTIRNRSYKTNLCNQNLEELGNICRQVGGFDLKNMTISKIM